MSKLKNNVVSVTSNLVGFSVFSVVHMIFCVETSKSQMCDI